MTLEINAPLPPSIDEWRNDASPAAPSATITFRPMEEPGRMRQMMLDCWGIDAVPFDGVLTSTNDFEAIGAFSIEDTLIGFALVRYHDGLADIATVNALAPGFGAGQALVDHIVGLAPLRGAKRLRTLVANDNLAGLRFFQCNGFVLAALFPNAIALYRGLLPQLPRRGQYGIPVRDVLQLERAL